MKTNFEIMTDMQYKVKALSHRVALFESGEMYQRIVLEMEQEIKKRDRIIVGLRLELANTNADFVTFRNNWFEAERDYRKEFERELNTVKRQLKKMETRALKAEASRDKYADKFRDKCQELSKEKVKNYELQGMNKKLKITINRDYRNSSVPSSEKPYKRKKITNSRVSTGKKPGAQVGHKGHKRKKQTPTNLIAIPTPVEYLDTTKYKPTGKTITKQLVNVEIRLNVDEYTTPEYRNLVTGQRVHAPFPVGLTNEVTYGGSIKALAFLLNSHCFVSFDKIRDLIRELTDGRLNLSKGMLSGINKDISEKTDEERKKIFEELLRVPVMNTDFTGVKVNGKNNNVIVCADSDNVLYLPRKNKGHRGIKGTPIELYTGILVHDHDVTFYNYGGEHQECLSHVLRYLKSSMENEKNLEWNKEMYSLLQAMIHHSKKEHHDIQSYDKDIKEYQRQFLEVLEKAKDEYDYEPPSDYYKDGYNLYLRLEKYADNHLLFLFNPEVPTTNNLSERLLRTFKRKLKQMMTFRSFESLGYFCDVLSMVEKWRHDEENLFHKVSSLYV